MATKNLLSLGGACAGYQRPVAEIECALRAVGAEPAMSLNGTLYWLGSDVARAVHWLLERDQETRHE